MGRDEPVSILNLGENIICRSQWDDGKGDWKSISGKSRRWKWSCGVKANVTMDVAVVAFVGKYLR